MKKFSNSFRGYNKREVNQVIAAVTKEYESMLNRLKAQDLEIERLKENLTKYKNIEHALNKTILVAEDTSHQIKRMAREESKGILEEAKRNASKITNDALLKAKKYEEEAENLRNRIIAFKRKFRQAIEAEVENIQELPEEY